MISVGRNQNQIFGKINGVKITNLPLDLDLFEKLKVQAKNANEVETKDLNSYKSEVDKFKALLGTQEVVAVVEKAKEEKKAVKVGSGKLSIKLVDDKPYLFNQAGLQSKFYIPTYIYARITTGEDKGIDTTPLFKFMIRALRGEKMTQNKLNNLDLYMNRDWLDKEKYNELLEKGISESSAKEQATFKQVPITLEGLIHTYKVSRVISDTGRNINEYKQEEVELEEEVVEQEDTSSFEKPAFEEFKFVPKRNNKGHFLARGSQEYIDEYNLQFTAYNEKYHPTQTTTTLVKKDGSKEKVVVNKKSAEDYVFQPYYQQTGGDAFYCGNVLGHEIRVGKVHKLPSWSMVNTNDSHSGTNGLHVGGLEYVHDNNMERGTQNATTHNVFVDPQFIGAVVNSEDQYGAIRVKEYFVHSSFIAPNKGSYNSSTYAAMTDAEWDKQVADALEVIEQAKKAQEFLDNSFVA